MAPLLPLVALRNILRGAPGVGLVARFGVDAALPDVLMALASMPMALVLLSAIRRPVHGLDRCNPTVIPFGVVSLIRFALAARKGAA